MCSLVLSSAFSSVLPSAAQCCAVCSQLTLTWHLSARSCWWDEAKWLTLWRMTPSSWFLVRQSCQWCWFHPFHLPLASDLWHYVRDIFTAQVFRSISSLALRLCAVPLATRLRLNATRSQPPGDTWMPAANYSTFMVDDDFTGVVIKSFLNDGVCTSGESATKQSMVLLWLLIVKWRINKTIRTKRGVWSKKMDTPITSP